MEVFNCPSMKSIPAICIALVLSAVAGEAPQAFEITLDLGADFVRDLRESTAAPVLGYAGSMIEYPDSMLQWLFVTNRAETIGDDSGALRLSDGVFYGDAVLASPTLASTNLIVGTTAKIQSLAGIPVLHYDVGRIAEVLAFDVHPRSKAGRWTAAGYVTDNEWSPAIDAGNPADAVGGEPKPNGAHINLGRFGGTGQASLSKRIGLIIFMR